jgi:hypothetical protein
VPDIDHGHFAAFMQDLVDHAIVADTYPVQVFCTRELVRIAGNGLMYEFFNMLENAGDVTFGNIPEIFFNAFPESDRIRFHRAGSHHALFKLGKTYRAFVPTLGNHGQIVEFLLEMLVFREREDDSDLVPVFVNYVLFCGTQGSFPFMCCTHGMI